MKRRVVLYNPESDFYTMPLALLAIGSHLDRERYEPVIVDGRLERDARELRQLVEEEDAVVGQADLPRTRR